MRIWRLGIKGIVTFNLDTCAVDSFASVNHCAVDSATSKDVARFSNFLSSPYQFVFQPHGHVSDTETWVFTQSDKNRLFGITAYQEFMKSLFQNYHLLILGFSASDFAFSHLIQQALAGRSTTGPKHYLLLSGASPSDIHTYSDKGMEVIPYTTPDQQHAEIDALLEDILGYTPSDDIPPSVYLGAKTDFKSLPPDDELIKLPITEIRSLLNGAIASIIPPDSSPNKDDIDILQRFYSEHVRAIHMAWLIHPSADCDIVHGYQVKSKKLRGAFGQVYEAVSLDTKSRAAIKVLLPEVRESADYLTCFRRGVKSMRILTAHNISRMVKLYDAFEVPACIAMEYIDGPTLTEATSWGYVDSIDRCLDAIVQIGETVVAAHNLEERVLHRDLKPDNIILRDLYNKTDSIDVVVLDFDLSWHKGAYEMSVVQGARAQGYAAPEQTATGLRSGVSTRNTAVDVFGFGMLAYFIFVGSDPRPNEHNISGYESRIRDAIKKRHPSNWRALPNYLAGLVESCTREDQDKRISMAIAIAGFKEAHRMVSSDCLRSSHPLILEEIAANLESEGTITRSDFGRTLVVQCMDPSKEFELALKNDGDCVFIAIRITKMQSTGDNRSVGKYLDDARNRALSRLNTNVFSNVRGVIGMGRVDIYARWILGKTANKKSIAMVCERLSEARSALKFG